jgi:hypothetical protein
VEKWLYAVGQCSVTQHTKRHMRRHTIVSLGEVEHVYSGGKDCSTNNAMHLRKKTKSGKVFVCCRPVFCTTTHKAAHEAAYTRVHRHGGTCLFRQRPDIYFPEKQASGYVLLGKYNRFIVPFITLAITLGILSLHLYQIL